MSFETYETDADTTDFKIKTVFGGLIGEWTSTETIHKSKFCPEQTTSQGKTRFSFGLGGAIVVSEHAQSIDGQQIYAQHAVFRRDKSGAVILYSFDSGDAPPDEFRGALRNGVMRLQAENAGGRWRTWLDVSELESAGTYKTRSEFLHDGVWATNTTATYTRAD